MSLCLLLLRANTFDVSPAQNTLNQGPSLRLGDALAGPNHASSKEILFDHRLPTHKWHHVWL